MSVARSKRKVLGRKEPSDSFSCRQSLMSPVKHSTSGSDLRNLTLGSSQRSSSRNENFMALLQKKGSKSSSGGTRVSAMELLKSTNPLAKRVPEFSAATPSSSAEGGEAASSKPSDPWTKAKLTRSLWQGQRSLLILQRGAYCTEGFWRVPNHIAPATDWPLPRSLGRVGPPSAQLCYFRQNQKDFFSLTVTQEYWSFLVLSCSFWLLVNVAVGQLVGVST